MHRRGSCRWTRRPSTPGGRSTIGRIRGDGQFDLVWSSEKAVRPIPYPPSRSQAEWESFLEGCTEAGAAGPTLVRATAATGARCTAPEGLLRSKRKRRPDAGPGSSGWRSVHLPPRSGRPAMSLRMGSFTLLGSASAPSCCSGFWCISLIPCGVLTARDLVSSPPSRLKKSVRQGLLAIADAKTTQLEIYVRERRADMNMAGRTPSLVNAMHRLTEVRRKEPLDSPAYLEAGSPVRPFVANFAESFGYANCLSFRHRRERCCSGSSPTWTWDRTS